MEINFEQIYAEKDKNLYTEYQNQLDQQLYSSAPIIVSHYQKQSSIVDSYVKSIIVVSQHEE